VYENNAMHQLILAHFPAETQKWLWGSGDPVRDARIASTGWSPRRAVAKPVDGGYVLDGHWEFASGSFNCDLDLLSRRSGAWAPPGPPGNRLFILQARGGRDRRHLARDILKGAGEPIVVRDNVPSPHVAWAEVNHAENGVRGGWGTRFGGTAYPPGTGWAGRWRPR
jgi:hypothetical protein